MSTGLTLQNAFYREKIERLESEILALRKELEKSKNLNLAAEKIISLIPIGFVNIEELKRVSRDWIKLQNTLTKSPSGSGKGEDGGKI